MPKCARALPESLIAIAEHRARHEHHAQRVLVDDHAARSVVEYETLGDVGPTLLGLVQDKNERERPECLADRSRIAARAREPERLPSFGGRDGRVASEAWEVGVAHKEEEG